MEKPKYADFFKKETPKKEELKEKINTISDAEKDDLMVDFGSRYRVRRAKTVRESAFMIKGFKR